MIRKCQFAVSCASTSVVDKFYALGGLPAQYEPEPGPPGKIRLMLNNATEPG